MDEFPIGGLTSNSHGLSGLSKITVCSLQDQLQLPPSDSAVLPMCVVGCAVLLRLVGVDSFIAELSTDLFTFCFFIQSNHPASLDDLRICTMNPSVSSYVRRLWAVKNPCATSFMWKHAHISAVKTTFALRVVRFEVNIALSGQLMAGKFCAR